jgi:hypothetical protein
VASLQKLDTVLYEVQQACIQMSLPPPTGVYDSQDENALLMGSVANLAGIMVSEAFDWQALRKPLILTADGVTTNFALPADFSRLVDDTGWSTSINRPIVVLNAQQWATVKSWIGSSFTMNPACRIVQNNIAFVTAPPPGNITFEYIDANWVIDANDPTITKQKATNNGDVPRFDWLLMMLAIKMKWLEQKGMNTTAVQSDFNDRFSQLTQRDQMAQTLTLSGPVPGSFRFLDNFANTPETGFGS